MIYIDIDGVCVDFVGTAKKFGVELEHNKFGVWKWNEPITPAEFYKVAELQPWALKLIDALCDDEFNFITMDYSAIKTKWLRNNSDMCYVWDYEAIEAPDKSAHCKHPADLLIDDNPAECQRWRDKGGIAYHFDLADPDPFGKFLKWWRLGK